MKQACCGDSVDISALVRNSAFLGALFVHIVYGCGTNEETGKSEGDCWWELWYFWIIVALFLIGIAVVVVVYCKQHAKNLRINALGRRLNHQMVLPPAPPSYDEPGHEPPPYHIVVTDQSTPPPPATPVSGYLGNLDPDRPISVRAGSVPPPYSPLPPQGRNPNAHTGASVPHESRPSYTQRTHTHHRGYFGNYHVSRARSNTQRSATTSAAAQYSGAAPITPHREEELIDEDYEIVEIPETAPRRLFTLPAASAPHNHAHPVHPVGTESWTRTGAHETSSSPPQRSIHTSALQQRLSRISPQLPNTPEEASSPRLSTSHSYNMAGSSRPGTTPHRPSTQRKSAAKQPDSRQASASGYGQTTQGSRTLCSTPLESDLSVHSSEANRGMAHSQSEDPTRVQN